MYICIHIYTYIDIFEYLHIIQARRGNAQVRSGGGALRGPNPANTQIRHTKDSQKVLVLNVLCVPYSLSLFRSFSFSRSLSLSRARARAFSLPLPLTRAPCASRKPSWRASRSKPCPHSP